MIFSFRWKCVILRVIRNEQSYVLRFLSVESARVGYVVFRELHINTKPADVSERPPSPEHRQVLLHDDVIKGKHFPRYWSFVRGIHRSPVNSSHKGQWRGALMFSVICAWTNGCVNNRDAGDLRCHQTHYDVTLMEWRNTMTWANTWRCAI